eukprot:CAMPEP_0181208766 /NCGR_PEP_ID=MMETSP1096-20121128/22299_1 /TAXON_ID=156174 ORGANISM="Chrysochromulina ericina, Strain CCMP281" /NCGR_SAMPLE_ID=MMETSP1096 /ASSEMBLY_ACC=CAM_ASM_000453 /LENGTH=77 /DNA_ID=CAMNT_0023299865 /DNA_START=169 /DNA_END=402 /DNA_ORIENTATION=-
MAQAAAPPVYFATHAHTQPPDDQVITTEKTNILLRQFQQRADARKRETERLKRPGQSDSPLESGSNRLPKQPRAHGK